MEVTLNADRNKRWRSTENLQNLTVCQTLAEHIRKVTSTRARRSVFPCVCMHVCVFESRIGATWSWISGAELKRSGGVCSFSYETRFMCETPRVHVLPVTSRPDDTPKPKDQQTRLYGAVRRPLPSFCSPCLFIPLCRSQPLSIPSISLSLLPPMLTSTPGVLADRLPSSLRSICNTSTCVGVSVFTSHAAVFGC